MAFNTQHQSDRHYNSNYLKERKMISHGDTEDLSDIIDESGRLSKTTSNKNIPKSKYAKKVCISYNNMFVDNVQHKAKRNSQCRSTTMQNSTPSVNYMDDSLSLCSSDHSYDQTRLLGGGTNRTQQEVDKLILSPSQCKIPASGLDYSAPKKQVNLIHLQLSDSHTIMNFECPNLPLPHVGKSKARGTQTLYRESSAQTLPYLPGVINDPNELETLEVFKLPTILPGDGPPGLYEVEVLERARKRWAFAKALKENFRKQLQESREEAKLRQHNHVLEAFEWEHWLEREEYIQECQMLRLEILIRMFDKREKQMQTASMARIEKSCAMIGARKQAALKKNEISHARALRRLEIKHAKQPRVWRKEHISQELGDPSSEFYAPKMRNGVNPSRRHFQASRKDFNMRMDDLEKTAIKMDYKHLKCPFAKVKEWSKPKEVVQEVEQNFCSEANLKKLYDSLRTLRASSIKQKTTPLCLKAKIGEKQVTKPIPLPQIEIEETKIEKEITQIELPITSLPKVSIELEESKHKRFKAELRKQAADERQKVQMLYKEMRCEEMEALINSYEGDAIGWLMRFLSEEMSRLMEQRKLQFFTMVAKRERWHREAAEAGLRQKENYTRQEYGKLYKEFNNVNMDMAEKLFSDIIDTDISDYAAEKSEYDTAALARNMDKEITGWLESFRDIQNPLNYETLRFALLNICMIDKNHVIYCKERDDCINYIINDVIFVNVYRLLETQDISFAIASDFVDRLIDNDTHLISSDCSSECDCTSFCSCSYAHHEAMAIIRKAIRRAVPGRRWRTSNERIAYENIRDLLDEVFEIVKPKSSVIEIDMKTPANVPDQPAHTDLVDSENDLQFSVPSDNCCSDDGSIVKISTISAAPKIRGSLITKQLQCMEKLLLSDPDTLSADRLIIHSDKYIPSHRRRTKSDVHEIPSTHEITSDMDFSNVPTYCQESTDETEEKVSEYLNETNSSNGGWALETSSSNRSYSEENEEKGTKEDEEDDEEAISEDEEKGTGEDEEEGSKDDKEDGVEGTKEEDKGTKVEEGTKEKEKGTKEEGEETKEEENKTEVKEEGSEEKKEEIHSTQTKLKIEDTKFVSVYNSITESTQLINDPKTTVKIADHVADDDKSVIPVQFSYSPSLNYTIVVPSSHIMEDRNKLIIEEEKDINETE